MITSCSTPKHCSVKAVYVNAAVIMGMLLQNYLWTKFIVFYWPPGWKADAAIHLDNQNAFNSCYSSNCWYTITTIKWGGLLCPMTQCRVKGRAQGRNRDTVDIHTLETLKRSKKRDVNAARLDVWGGKSHLSFHRWNTMRCPPVEDRYFTLNVWIWLLLTYFLGGCATCEFLPWTDTCKSSC